MDRLHENENDDHDEEEKEEEEAMEEEVELDASLFEDETSEDQSEAPLLHPDEDDTAYAWKRNTVQKGYPLRSGPVASSASGAPPPLLFSGSCRTPISLPIRKKMKKVLHETRDDEAVLEEVSALNPVEKGAVGTTWLSFRPSPPREATKRNQTTKIPTAGRRAEKMHPTPRIGEEVMISFTTNGDGPSSPPRCARRADANGKTSREEVHSPSHDVEKEKPSLFSITHRERAQTPTAVSFATTPVEATMPANAPIFGRAVEEKREGKRSEEKPTTRNSGETESAMPRGAICLSSRFMDASFPMKKKECHGSKENDVAAAGAEKGDSQASLVANTHRCLPPTEEEREGVAMPWCREDNDYSSPSSTTPTLANSLSPSLSTFYPECEKWEAHDTFFLSAMSDEMDS